MARDLLGIEVDDAVAVLRLTRPEKRNALNQELVERVGAFFGDPPEGIRAAVLLAEGDHFCAGLDLDERDEVRRVEGMPDYNALGARTSCLHHGGCQARRAACEQGGRRCRAIEHREQLLLVLDALRPVLLHEISGGNRVSWTRDERQAVDRSPGTEADALEGRPVRRHSRAQALLGPGGGI